jgi:uncharacterized protein with von Willebrand factor type A (vWA) domain
MKLKDRATRLFSRRQVLEENAVVHSKIDAAVLRDWTSRAPALQAEIDNTPTTSIVRSPHASYDEVDQKAWEHVIEDSFYSFFGDYEPTIRPRERMDPRFQLNRDIADKFSRSEEFTDNHPGTRGRPFESVLGTLGAAQSLRQSYSEELAEHAKTQNDVGTAQDALDDIDAVLETLREQRANGEFDQSAIDQQIRDAAKGKREIMDNLSAAVAKQQSQSIARGAAVTRAVAKAAKAAGEAVECASLIPGKDGGVGSKVNPMTMLALAERVKGSDVIRKVLDMMGRIELSMGNTRRTLRKGGFEEMVDVETGDDLRLILPFERALLTHPLGQLEFFRRYSERSLMQYEVWSEVDLKRGPLIICADGSLSMGGAPNVFARGLTLAAIGIANREKRDAVAVEFGSHDQLRAFAFYKGQAIDPSLALDFAEHFFGGGTDINSALAYAHEIMMSEAEFHSADILLITDGGDHVTPETIRMRDELRAKGVKIHGIVVGGPITEYVSTVCDVVSNVTEFMGPNSTSDRLAIELT